MIQPDMKKLVAYSSVSHLGFVVLGIFSFNQIAMDGAVYQMLNHGISTGALFAIVGLLYERRHSLEIADYGGVATICNGGRRGACRAGIRMHDPSRQRYLPIGYAGA